MYLRKAISRQRGKTYINHLLVESVHTPKGPRQRVICSLGSLAPRPKEEWLKLAHKVEDALVGQMRLGEAADPEVDAIVRKVRVRQEKVKGRLGKPATPGSPEEPIAVLTSRVRTEDHREAGPAHVGLGFWKRLGLDEILTEVGLSARARLLTCAMTMNRLIHPKSENAMPDWMRRTALSDLLGTDISGLSEDALYRNMGRLHPKREMIETALWERERELFNLDTTVFLYDLTSTYFEGAAEANPKAQRGYSRDHRPDCKQVVVGLALGADGFPRAHEVLRGNLLDTQTVESMLDCLDRRVGLKAGQTVVVDRGMSYAANLAQIRSRGLHYLVAARQAERDQWLADFEDPEGFEAVMREPSPRNPFQKKSKIEVKMRRIGDETHVLCVSSGRQEKDRAIREKHETRLLADLAKLKERIGKGKLTSLLGIGEAIGRIKERYPRVARYYDIAFDEETRVFSWRVNEELRGKAERLDGGYLLKTSRTDLDAEEVWRVYVLLTRVENAFRNMKSPLATRPIFHQLPRQVDTHIFLCVLAYHLLNAVEKTLLDRGEHTSWETVRDALTTHQVCTVVLPTADGSELRIRKGSAPEAEHERIYDLLGLPHQVMRENRWWSDAARTAGSSD